MAGFLADWQQPAIKALPAYLPYFAAGMLLALFVETRRAEGRKLELRPWATAGVMLLGIGLVVGNAWWHATSPGLAHDPLLVALHDFPAGVGFAFVILAVVAGHGPSLAWLQAKPLAKLGLISYGVYLWHVPLILFVKEMAADTPGALELAALVAPLAIAAGTASWIWVERPLMNAVNTRLPRTHARA